jgi:RND family efflux transporter MFP subunit
VAAFAGACFLLGVKARSAGAHAPTPPAPTADIVPVSAEGKAMIDIQMTTVHRQTLQESIHTTGQVLYSPDLTVKISPRLQGRVRQVLVRVGDSVTKGETLALLDSVDAATARTTDRQNQNALRQARINLDRTERLLDLGTPEVTQAQATLNQAQTNVRSTKDVLDKVKQQAQIGGFTQKPVEDAKNALVAAKSAQAQAQADLILAQKDYNRKVELVQIGVAARADLDASTDTLDKTKINVAACQETVRLAEEALEREQKALKSNLYADQQVNQAQFNYDQARLQERAAERALLLAKAAIRSTLEQARTDYQTAVLNAENSRQALSLLGQPADDGTLAIKAPISGVVTERFVAPGQVVDQSQMTPWQMFTLANTERVWVEASLYEKDLSAVAEGMPVRIYVAALPNQVFTGTVLHVAPALDKSSRALKVRAEIDNHRGILKDGMYADVDIVPPKGRQAVLIPLEAIVQDQDSDYVYLEAGGRYQKRLIQLGEQREGKAIVTSGLHPGERIVTHGALYLGTQVSGD